MQQTLSHFFLQLSLTVLQRQDLFQELEQMWRWRHAGSSTSTTTATPIAHQLTPHTSHLTPAHTTHLTPHTASHHGLHLTTPNTTPHHLTPHSC